MPFRLPTSKLTVRQAELLRLMGEYFVEHGCSPTIRWLCAKMAISSPNGIMCHIRSMERQGYLVMIGQDAESRRYLISGMVEAVRSSAKEHMKTMLSVGTTPGYGPRARATA